MSDKEKLAEDACRQIAAIEGWTSAPGKEAVYKAGFFAGYEALNAENSLQKLLLEQAKPLVIEEEDRAQAKGLIHLRRKWVNWLAEYDTLKTPPRSSHQPPTPDPKGSGT